MANVETCTKCGSEMRVAKNKRSGFYAVCSTPERHDGHTPETIPEPVPQPAPASPPLPQSAPKKSFLDHFFT